MARIGDPDRWTAFALHRASAVGWRVQHGQHRDGDRRQNEKPRLELDHWMLPSLSYCHDEPGSGESTADVKFFFEPFRSPDEAKRNPGAVDHKSRIALCSMGYGPTLSGKTGNTARPP